MSSQNQHIPLPDLNKLDRKPDWLAVDWGTSRLRVWAMQGVDTVLAGASSNRGMIGLAPDEFEAALLESIGSVLHPDRVMPVIACGMVGAKTGWQEAPYVEVPNLPLTAAGAVCPQVRDKRMRVWILPGMCQYDQPDVMRGEETQIAGLLGTVPEFSGTICLPGTHAKWATVENGQLTRFRTALTGELFDLLAHQSVLRSVIAEDAFDDATFDQAVMDTVAGKNDILHQFFAIRASALLHQLDPGVARARLSGLLIGSDVTGYLRSGSARKVEIIGAGRLANLYGRALELHGIQTQTYDADVLTPIGLAAAYAQLQDG